MFSHHIIFVFSSKRLQWRNHTLTERANTRSSLTIGRQCGPRRYRQPFSGTQSRSLCGGMYNHVSLYSRGSGSGPEKNSNSDPVPNRTLNPPLPEPPQALAASRDPAPRPSLPLDLRVRVASSLCSGICWFWPLGFSIAWFDLDVGGSGLGRGRPSVRKLRSMILRSDDGGCGGERGKARCRQLYPQTLSGCLYWTRKWSRLLFSPFFSLEFSLHFLF